MAKTSKNKIKHWRKTASKGSGRALRNAMARFTMGAIPNNLMISLMKLGGISTPVFDSYAKKMHNVPTQEPIPEGAISEAV